jgi:hypothetical protein
MASRMSTRRLFCGLSVLLHQQQICSKISALCEIPADKEHPRASKPATARYATAVRRFYDRIIGHQSHHEVSTVRRAVIDGIKK